MTYLFKNNRISIGSKHGIHISRKMTKHEITKLFKMHDDICKHEYVTVFRPHKQISSSERNLKYRETQKPQVNNISASKQPESLGVDAPGHNSFIIHSHIHQMPRCVERLSKIFAMSLNLPILKKEDALWSHATLVGQ